MDECVWILADDVTADRKGVKDVPRYLRERMTGEQTTTTGWPTREVHGVLGVHVDDLIGGGDHRFQKAIMWLKTELEFGAWEQTKFRFRGRELEQTRDKRVIRVSMEPYVDSLVPMAVSTEMRKDLDAIVSPQTHTQYRGGIGQLQWLQMQGNPMSAYDTSILQSYSAAPNGHHVLMLNKTIRTAKKYRDLYYHVVAMQNKFTWVILADAAWANRPDGSSTGGHLILAVHNSVTSGQRASASVVSWNSRKIRRKVRSSLGAETQSFSTALEHGDLIRVFWGELNGEIIDLENFEEYLRQTRALAISDCKSLADALNNSGRAVSKTSDDKRLAIELSMIKQRLHRDETLFQWVENMYMAADVLTKGVERGNVTAMVKILTESNITVKPTEQMLETRAQQREQRVAKKLDKEMGYYEDTAKDFDEEAEPNTRYEDDTAEEQSISVV